MHPTSQEQTKSHYDGALGETLGSFCSILLLLGLFRPPSSLSACCPPFPFSSFVLASSSSFRSLAGVGVGGTPLWNPFLLLLLPLLPFYGTVPAKPRRKASAPGKKGVEAVCVFEKWGGRSERRGGGPTWTKKGCGVKKRWDILIPSPSPFSPPLFLPVSCV